MYVGQHRSWDDTNPGMEAVSSPTYAATMRQIEDLVKTLLPPGQYLYHLDVVVASRSATDTTKGSYQRFPAVGSDPLLSVGALTVTLDELRVSLNPGLDLRQH